MRACRAEPHLALARDPADIAPQLQQLLADVRRRVADRSRDLEDGLHQLGVDPGLELVAAHGGEHRVDVLDEVVRLGVEEHVLLLCPQRVRVALAERMVENAAALCEAASLARDRRRVDLLHGSTASTSISTSHRSSKSRAMVPVHAGRTSPKASPCARMASATCSASVTKTRVRTTFERPVPASCRAFSTISRHRFICAYALAGGSAPSAMIGAVPATWTFEPETTARL